MARIGFLAPVLVALLALAGVAGAAPPLSTRLPIVVIDADGPIVDDPKVGARMRVIHNARGALNTPTGRPTVYDGRIGIEVRGQSSQRFPKKQFALETLTAAGGNRNVSLLGLPEENDWVLYAAYNDGSLLRNVVAYRAARETGRYASRTRFVEVVLNGRYWGVYVLMEKLKLDPGDYVLLYELFRNYDAFSASTRTNPVRRSCAQRRLHREHPRAARSDGGVPHRGARGPPPGGRWQTPGVRDPGHVALGSWSGGVHMHFGLPIDEERLVALLRPDAAIGTVITADAYGAGAADLLVGRALAGLARDDYCLVGAVGHDFYDGERQGSKGYPRFTDPSLRGPDGYADYLRRATERSLARCGTDRFDLLLLHNPDRVGYSSEVVWRAMTGLREEGLTGAIGVAPGPANGFTLDLIGCLERYGDQIDWAMIILSPFEPWPARLVLPALERNNVRAIARVVDHGGVFHGDVPDEGELPAQDHRSFRPPGWVQHGRERLERLRPIGEAHGLTSLQLACQWTLAHGPVECVVPTLIQEAGAQARPVEDKRADLAGVPAEIVLGADELATIEGVGENAGCMVLKGGTPAHEGAERPDSWPLTEDLRVVADRWSIVPERDLVKQ